MLLIIINRAEAYILSIEKNTEALVVASKDT